MDWLTSCCTNLVAHIAKNCETLAKIAAESFLTESIDDISMSLLFRLINELDLVLSKVKFTLTGTQEGRGGGGGGRAIEYNYTTY